MTFFFASDSALRQKVYSVVDAGHHRAEATKGLILRYGLSVGASRPDLMPISFFTRPGLCMNFTSIEQQPIREDRRIYPAMATLKTLLPTSQVRGGKG